METPFQSEFAVINFCNALQFLSQLESHVCIMSIRTIKGEDEKGLDNIQLQDFNPTNLASKQ
jgi:hypothetical protein